MLKRKITDEMLAWKNTSNKKALIVKGLRQVGKTTSVRAFAQENYENVVYVNFKRGHYRVRVKCHFTVYNSSKHKIIPYNLGIKDTLLSRVEFLLKYHYLRHTLGMRLQ